MVDTKSITNERLKFFMEQENIEEYQEEVDNEIKKAIFLLPIGGSDDLINLSMSKQEFNPPKGTMISINPLSDDSGNYLLPLFTDAGEVRKGGEDTMVFALKINAISEVILNKNELINFVVINPYSEFSLKLPRERFLELSS